MGGPTIPDVCGDGIRNPGTEECDDGAKETGACTSSCRVRPLSIAEGLSPGEPFFGARTLPWGHHLVAAGDTGFAALFVGGDSGQWLSLRSFSASGEPLQGDAPVQIDDNNTSHKRATVVWVPGQGYVTIASGNLLGGGSGVRIFSATGKLRDKANSTPTGPFAVPDACWTGSELVVAWSDAPAGKSEADIWVRRFSKDLKPLGPEEPLAASSAQEALVVVEPFAAAWAAAWYSFSSAGMAVRVRTAGGTSWSVESLPPPNEGFPPALVPLDEHRLALFFALSSADSPSTTDSRIGVALLDTASPGLVPYHVLEALPGAQGGAASPDMTRIATLSAARAAGRLYVAFTTGPAYKHGAGEDVWLREIGLPLDTAHPSSWAQREWPLPPSAEGRALDQGFASLAAIGDTALATIWSDTSGMSLGETVDGDVRVTVLPAPIVRAGK